MNLLVTGGAGYIGSIVGAQLVEAGHQVTVLDNLSKGHRWAVPDAARFIQGDLEDRAVLHRVLADAFDGVLHFAARSLVAESVEQPRQYYRNNLCGTLNLLDAMADAGVPRLVFSSTAAVYGHPQEVPIS
jgi:UDP-glucose 4-epimerase